MIIEKNNQSVISLSERAVLAQSRMSHGPRRG